MAKPRVFVSSTYYNLRHIRSSLELFIESLGYEPVLSEKGAIAFNPDVALDESCYRESGSVDIFVLVIGGRYGSEISKVDSNRNHDFYDRYDSITRLEYETAVRADIPIYILMESAVSSEYQTYLKNRDNKTVTYAHVDSINIFKLIEFILSQPRNNPVYNFDRSSQIENWLRDQWSGLFREMLRARSQQKQLVALTERIEELKTVNNTLKNYLENLMKKVDPKDSEEIIRREDQRIKDENELSFLMKNELIRYLSRTLNIPFTTIRDAVTESQTVLQAITRVRAKGSRSKSFPSTQIFANDPDVLRDANEVRKFYGLPLFLPTPTSVAKDASNPRIKKDNDSPA